MVSESAQSCGDSQSWLQSNRDREEWALVSIQSGEWKPLQNIQTREL